MLGRIGCVGVAICAAAIVLMHVVQPTLNPVDVAVSYYLNGRRGAALGIGLVALGIGSLSLAAGLRATLDRSGAKAGWWLLVVWGVGSIVGGIFPPDPYGQWDQPPSVPGMVHGTAGLLAFLAFSPAAWLLSRRTAAHVTTATGPRVLERLAGLSLLVLLAFFVCLVPVFAGGPPFALGLVERVLLALNLAWVAVASSIVAGALATPR
jgi:hypothetical protein